MKIIKGILFAVGTAALFLWLSALCGFALGLFISGCRAAGQLTLK